MKITNASKKIYGQAVAVNTDGIRIGADPSMAGAVVTVCLMFSISYFIFKADQVLIGSIVVLISIWGAYAVFNEISKGEARDKRKHYGWAEIEKFELVSSDHVSSKSGLGTLGGAAAGGLRGG